MAIVKFDPFFRSFPTVAEDWEWPEFESKQGLDVYETNEEMVVEAPVPGINKEDLDITVEQGVVRIKGEAKEEKEEEKGKNYFRQESRKSFYYTTTLPSRGEWDEAEAEIENGVVKISIPKSEEEKPKKIEVKSK
ncbi:MAG: Hsp20/alpha crystallin family protein [Patescibacteria group bacterium]